MRKRLESDVDTKTERKRNRQTSWNGDVCICRYDQNGFCVYVYVQAESDRHHPDVANASFSDNIQIFPSAPIRKIWCKNQIFSYSNKVKYFHCISNLVRFEIVHFHKKKS